MKYFELEPGIFSKGDLRAQWQSLDMHNPSLAYLTKLYAYESLGSIIITSIWRPNPSSVHSWYRGVDIRLYNQNRITENKYAGQAEVDASEILSRMSDAFHYDDTHKIYRIHGEDLDRHVHLQTKRQLPWTTV